MMIVLHILFAIAGLAATTYACFRPAAGWMRAAYGFVGGTVATGTYLALSQPAHLTQTCISGLTYVGFTLAGLRVAHFRLERVAVRAEVRRDIARRE